MKQLFGMALGLAICVAPAQAQMIGGASRIGGASSVATGGFAGARIRIAFGGARGDRKSVRAGLTVAPVQQRRDAQGQAALPGRIGEGFEFGITGDVPVAHFSLAGQYLGPARYAPGERVPTGKRSNLSGGTTTAVVIGLGALVGVGLLLALKNSGDPDSCTGGECNNN